VEEMTRHELRINMSNELHLQMKDYPEVNWIKLCRLAINYYMATHQKTANNLFPPITSDFILKIQQNKIESVYPV